MVHVFFKEELYIPKKEAECLLNTQGVQAKCLWPGDAIDKNGVEVLVTTEHKVDLALLENFPNLKAISLGFSGYDEVDREECKRRNISLFFIPDYSSESVAELAVGLAISVLRNIPKCVDSVRAGLWDRTAAVPGRALGGKTVAIVGLGHIGQQAGKLFAAFGCDVVGTAGSQERPFPFRRADLESAARQADILSIHLPSNPETVKLLAQIVPATMKRESILINTSRGSLLNEDSILQALDSGHLAGAGLDVLQKEDPAIDKDTPSSRLARHPNVLTTPHIGFKTREALIRKAEMAVINAAKFLQGQPPNLI